MVDYTLYKSDDGNRIDSETHEAAKGRQLLDSLDNILQFGSQSTGVVCVLAPNVAIDCDTGPVRKRIGKKK